MLFEIKYSISLILIGRPFYLQKESQQACASALILSEGTILPRALDLYLKVNDTSIKLDQDLGLLRREGHSRSGNCHGCSKHHRAINNFHHHTELSQHVQHRNREVQHTRLKDNVFGRDGSCLGEVRRWIVFEVPTRIGNIFMWIMYVCIVKICNLLENFLFTTVSEQQSNTSLQFLWKYEFNSRGVKLGNTIFNVYVLFLPCWCVSSCPCTRLLACDQEQFEQQSFYP